MNTLATISLLFFVLLQLLQYLRRNHLTSFIWSVLCRWIKCAFFTSALGALFISLNIQTNIYASLCLGFCIFALAESLLYAFKIFILNKVSNELNLTPKYSDNNWLNTPTSLKLKDDLELQEFKILCYMRADVVPEFTCPIAVFESIDKKTRIIISFIPFGNIYTIDTEIISMSCDKVFITENSTNPQMFIYPLRYKITHKSFIENPLSILRKHNTIIENETLVEMNDDMLEMIDKMQKDSLLESIRKGIANPKNERAIKGMLTTEGRYRYLRATILMNYFGISSNG